MKYIIFFIIITIFPSYYTTTIADTNTSTLDTVWVTASRIDESTATKTNHISIISDQEIQQSAAKNLPELLAEYAGVFSRSLFGDGTRSTVDIRGFGASSTQNTLILIDGKRLNDIDLSAINYNSIPLDNIARIEIIRGSTGVLYGDGSVGGSINIITKQSQQQGLSGQVNTTYATNSHQQYGINLSYQNQRFSSYMAANQTQADNYRNHNDLNQDDLYSDIRWFGESTEIYFKNSYYNQRLQLPGPRIVDPNINLDQLKDNPQGSDTLNDFAKEKAYQTILGLLYHWGQQNELILDVAYKKKNQQAFFDDYTFGGLFASYLDTDLTTFSLTPRLNINYQLWGKANTLITGIDYYHYQYDSKRALNPDTIDQAIHDLDIKQDSTAVYLHNTMTLNTKTQMVIGVRWQNVKLTAKDEFDATAPGALFDNQAPDYDQQDSELLLELGLSYQIQSSIELFSKIARSARFATVDELFEFDPNRFVRVFSPLKPQTSKHIDLGIKYRQAKLESVLTWFYMRLNNEIHFNSASFSNENLDKTERTGLEWSNQWQLLNNLSLKANYTYTQAKFRQGVFDGNTIPLVPKHSSNLAINWQINQYLKFASSWQHIGAKYFDNDQANQAQKIPHYDQVNLKLSAQWQALEFNIKVNNLLNSKAFNFGTISTFTPGRFSAFPLAERTIWTNMKLTF